MSITATRTTTYTVSDIRKVVDNFAADFSMMAQATGLRSREDVAKIVSDLKTFAEYGYLVQVTVFLFDNDGNKICAALYKVSESANGWQSERPGNNLWPRTEGGSLRVLGTLTDAWWNMGDADRQAFVHDSGLNSPWSPAGWDTSLIGLASSAAQKYASNGYGWERTNYAQ
jgi:hypothetical protein